MPRRQDELAHLKRHVQVLLDDDQPFIASRVAVARNLYDALNWESDITEIEDVREVLRAAKELAVTAEEIDLAAHLEHDDISELLDWLKGA